MPKEDPYDIMRHPAQLLRRAHQRSVQLFAQLDASRQLTSPQFVVLVTLLQYGPAPQNHIGQLVSMDPSTIGAVIRKLMDEELLKRERSPNDQRVQMISLTDAGRECAEQYIPVSSRAGERLLEPLSPAERALFVEWLDRILAGDSGSG